MHESLKDFRILYRHPTLSHFSQSTIKQLMISPHAGWKADSVTGTAPREVTEGWTVHSRGEGANTAIAEYWKGLGYDPFYRTNIWGFRDDDPPETPTNDLMALGCSCTLGQGVPEDHRWSDVLGRKIDKKIWNFGVSGGGIDCAYRLAVAWIPILQPKAVFLWHPPIHRYETPMLKTPQRLKQMNARHLDPKQNIFKRSKSGEGAIEEYRAKATNFWWLDIYELGKLQALEQLCQEYDAVLYTQWVDRTRRAWEPIDDLEGPMELARDNHHPGPNMHSFVAEQFVEAWRGARSPH